MLLEHMFYCLSCAIRFDILVTLVIWDGKSLLEACFYISVFPEQRIFEYHIVLAINNSINTRINNIETILLKSVLIQLVEKKYICGKMPSVHPSLYLCCIPIFIWESCTVFKIETSIIKWDIVSWWLLLSLWN